jgi:hypothetical protein
MNIQQHSRLSVVLNHNIAPKTHRDGNNVSVFVMSAVIFLFLAASHNPNKLPLTAKNGIPAFTAPVAMNRLASHGGSAGWW